MNTLTRNAMFSPDQIEAISNREKTIRDIREGLSISGTAAAEAIGVEQPTVYGWENSQEGSMMLSPEQLLKYIDLLKVSPDEFAGAIIKPVTLTHIPAKVLPKIIEALKEGLADEES